MKKSFRVCFFGVVKADIVDEDFRLEIGQDLRGLREEHEIVIAIEKLSADTPDYVVYKVTTNYYCDGDEDNIVEDKYIAVRI